MSKSATAVATVPAMEKCEPDRKPKEPSGSVKKEVWMLFESTPTMAEPTITATRPVQSPRFPSSLSLREILPKHSDSHLRERKITRFVGQG